MQNFTGKKIRSLRQKMGKNQESIAKILGITVPAFSKIETGVTDINLSRLKQIAQIFGISVKSLLDDDPIEIKKDQYILKLEDNLKLLRDEIIELQRRCILYMEQSKYSFEKRK